MLVNFLSNSLKFSENNSKVVVSLKLIEKQTIKLGNRTINSLLSNQNKKIKKILKYSSQEDVLLKQVKVKKIKRANSLKVYKN